MNILIPMAGLGQRFHQEGFLQPKPLVKVLGDPILGKLLECLNLSPDDLVILPYMVWLDTLWLIELLKKVFSVITLYDDLQNQKFQWHGMGKGNCILIEISIPTKGAVETLEITLPFFDKKKPLLSLDCDNIYNQSPCDNVRELKTSALLYFEDNQPNPIYSYIKTNSDKITQIKEKVKISDKACSGGYYFYSVEVASIYVKKVLYERKDGREMYISSVYQEMIEHGEIIVPVLAPPISFGIPMAVELYAKKQYHHRQKIFCFDLDSTILTPPILRKEYQTCQPIQTMVKFIQYLDRMGHRIIINTARGMRAYLDGDKAGQIHRDQIIKMLKIYEIPYHELIFGKPYADFYIDDKAVSIFTNLSRETGFYPSNDPVNMNHIIERKFGKYSKKGNLGGEYWWYTHIPDQIKDLFPPLLEGSSDTLIITKAIDGISFSDKFLEGTLTLGHLQTLFTGLDRIHRSSAVPKIDIYQNYLPKLKERMEMFGSKLYDRLEKGLTKYQDSKEGEPCVIHGDPVFTNVFLTCTHLVQFIDMRGILGKEKTIYGDRLYDLAKVYQSLTGYDVIYRKGKMPYNMSELLNYFETVVGHRLKWIYILTASLYFTLIPLHQDEEEDQIQQYLNMTERLLNKFDQYL